MGLVAGLARVVFFALLFWFALKNTDPVTVHLWAGRSLDSVPMVVVILASVALGSVGGILAMIPTVIRLSRRGLRREPTAAEREASEREERRSAEALANAAREAGAVGELGADTRMGMGG